MVQNFPETLPPVRLTALEVNPWGSFTKVLAGAASRSVMSEKITDEEFAEKMELQAKLEEQQKYLDELEDEIDEKTADQKVMEF